MMLEMATSSVPSTTTIVPFLLTQDNYEDWRIYMDNYLLAQDLWSIIESGDDADFLSSSNDVGYWRKKNAVALHAIHTTSSADIFAQIKEITLAKDAWNKLAKMHQEWQSKSKPKTDVEGWDGGEEDEITKMRHSEGSDGGEEDEMTEDSRCVELMKSICNGDWNAIERFFVFDKRPLNTTIFSGDRYTALHATIQAGHDKIAEELVKMMSVIDLEIKSGPAILEDTVLSLVAWTGSTHVAKCIVEKNRNLLTIENGDGHIPVTTACYIGQKEMTYYFYSETPAEVLAPRNGYHGLRLIRSAIANKMLDICYDLLRHHPSLTTKMTMGKDSPIYMLSLQPSAFLSGSRLRFWQRWIYHWLKVKLPPTSPGELRIPITHNQDLNKMEIGTQGFGRLCGLGLMLQNFFGIRHIYDLKLTHLLAHEIIRCMCNYVSTLKIQHRFDCQVDLAMFEATRQGIVEFVIELLKVNQPLVCYNEDRRDVFMIAIQYRQENIFNLFYGIHKAGKAQILNNVDQNQNNMLHVAGERAPDFRLVQISSPALQMQRELQWYKEVERIVPEWCKEAKNCNDETPYELLSNSHKKLVEKGAKWMKDTASSFIIVGTLIVTMLFAAAFTLPGGNDQSTGFPIFLWRRSFMIFITADAISFFAASTSVLMFLGILTSRFAPEDFLESLPRKLIIGLSTLFISIAAMMVSFSAALLIILQDRWWAIIPIIMMASIPVTLFVWLQFPLLVEIFVSTYASGIFNRKMKPRLHCRAS